MKSKYLLTALLLSMPFATFAAPFTVSTDVQEVIDVKTGLIWQRCAAGMMVSGGTCTGTPNGFTHQAALSYASTQASSTGVAWRLPNVKELSSIVDKSRIAPAIDAVAFPSTPASWYWSSTPLVGDASLAWSVDFGRGYVEVSHGSYRSNAYYVRLVRTGQ